MNRRQLDGMLGMNEMESAVEFMIQQSESTGVPFHLLEISPLDFPKDDGRLLIGFCHLLRAGNWIISSYPNSCFRVGQKLIDRMREFGFNVEDVLSSNEWYDHKYSLLTEKRGEQT